jgi:hypothetical protein
MHNKKWAEYVINESSGGTQGENWMKAKANYQGRFTKIRRFPCSQAGKGWIAWAVAKQTQWKSKTQGDYQARVHSGKMVLVVVRQRGWTIHLLNAERRDAEWPNAERPNAEWPNAKWPNAEWPNTEWPNNERQ